MKKHNMMRAASALAVVTLLSTSLISGTLAKYTSTASGSSTARVAKWSILAGTGNTLTAETDDITNMKNPNAMKFDLFSTVMDSDFKDEGEVKKAGNAEDSIIAPGTSGYIDLAIENKSDVAADYTIKFSDQVSENSTMGDVPLQFAVKKWAGTTAPDNSSLSWQESVSSLDNTTKGKLTTTDTDVKYRVYWKWDFEENTAVSGNKKNDTELGKKAQSEDTIAKPTITATVTATQAD